jgi:putative tricarboxylic transport membrane protein
MLLQVDAFIKGCAMLIDWMVPIYILAGIIIGILAGSIPGISGATAIALLLPLTFVMTPINAMVFLCSIYLSAIYSASISAILINCPGASPAILTTLDGYEMTKKGQSQKALALSLGASVIGGIISYIILLFFMKPLADFAIKFGSVEIFVLVLFTIITITAFQKSIVKGLMCGCLGLLLGTVGTGVTGSVRGSFDYIYLLDEIPFVPVLIGLFAFSEMLVLVDKGYISSETQKVEGVMRTLRNSLTVLKHPWLVLKSSIIGTIVGALPAAGSSVAAVISYNHAKQSMPKIPFGTGVDEGVIAPESSNNASSGGALMTMLSFGIPGSAATGLMLGALMMHGLQPGVRFFSTQTEFVYAIIMSLFLASVMLYVVTICLTPAFTKIISIPTNILVPVITIICLLGSYSMRYTLFDCIVMICFGVLGYIFKKHDYPIISLLIGILLGSMADTELVITHISFNGDLSVLFTRPIAIVLWLLTAAFLILPRIPKRDPKN